MVVRVRVGRSKRNRVTTSFLASSLDQSRPVMICKCQCLRCTRVDWVRHRFPLMKLIGLPSVLSFNQRGYYHPEWVQISLSRSICIVFPSASQASRIPSAILLPTSSLAVSVLMIFAWLLVQKRTNESVQGECLWLPFMLTSLFLDRFDPAASYKRAHTTLTSTGSVSAQSVSSPSAVRRGYTPMPSTTSTMVSSANTRKPRSYLSSATSIVKP